MTIRDNLHKYVFNIVFRFTRTKRMRLFAKVIDPRDGESVLDVGGNDYNWQYVSRRLRVELLNLFVAPITIESPIEFNSVMGDGTQLAYDDLSFDIGFSNSVIEHVGTKERQVQFASEIRRVGKKVWVQTPAREFFMEPHFFTPFVHWIPKASRKWVVHWFSFWSWYWSASREETDAMVEELRLLSKREMEGLFPDCRIITERFLFMPKSYIAVRD
ncbi:MAG: methyltransferase domain-containing protein [Planctomycetota bacterium]